jgi:hypothetical protein
MAWASVNATPIRTKEEAFDAKAFATAPASAESLKESSRWIAECLAENKKPSK